MKAFYNKPISPDISQELDQYILEGGFPKAIEYDSLADKQTYTKSVISEIFEKDIKRRVQVRKKSVFEKLQQYIINNFGATTSITNILHELKKRRDNHTTRNLK